MQDYYNQTLHLQLFGMMIGEWGKDGGLNRASLEYDVMDAFLVKGGVMIYQPGDSLYFQSLNDNDRIFFETRYSFWKQDEKTVIILLDLFFIFI